MLFLEIFLTAAAWRRGWGATALLPGLLCVALAVLMALSGGGSAAWVVDLLTVAALVAMVARPRTTQTMR